MASGPSTLLRRSRAVRDGLVGLAIGMVCLIAHLAGQLDVAGLQGMLEDWYARHLAGGAAGVSDEIVVLAIDDRALEEVGEWTWDREVMASVINELTRANARTIAVDLLFDRPRNRKVSTVDWRMPVGAGEGQLAAAMRRHGRVVIASNFSLADGESLRSQFDRVQEATPATANGSGEGSPLRVIDRFEALDVHRSRAKPLPEGTAGTWVRSDSPRPPLSALSSAASRLGNVTLIRSAEGGGVLRRVPMLVEYDGALWPGLGLAGVLEHTGLEWDVGTDGVQFDNASSEKTPFDRRAEANGFTRLMWARAGDTGEDRGWLGQFGDRVASITFVLRPALVRADIAERIEQLDRLTSWAGRELFDAPEWFEDETGVLSGLDPADVAWTTAYERRRDVWRRAAEEADMSRSLFDGVDLNEVSQEEAAYITDVRRVGDQMPSLLVQVEQLVEIQRIRRAELADFFDDKLVIIGWIATAGAADVVPTAIDPATPGTVVHAAIANALLRERSLVNVGALIEVLAVALGVVSVVSLGAFAPVRLALGGAVAIIASWPIFGALLWSDGVIMRVVDPMLAGVLAAAAVFSSRLLSEWRTRRVTERRFRSYLAPDVVDILVNRSDVAPLAPVRREVTVMFVDLAGFTPIAERLGTDRTGLLLNEIMARMTREVHARGGTLDKYVGDGLIAFWNAPLEREDHASSACAAAVGIVDAMRGLEYEPGRPVEVRVGIATGEVMVGDFGDPPRRSSYTVVGDAANQASRLEAANKLIGSTILATESTAERAPEFTWVDLGPARVRGREGAIGVRALTGVGDPDRTVIERIEESAASLRSGGTIDLRGGDH